ncbi:hypothetical protein P8S54_08095 [Thiomicrospira sp. R3]|uniref:hypothetical protein n=1 Tax=Thiomicrospira sp. R3 TaxID=3035472 RepID=UPI00259BD61E|nr:hypothetical protein [Thiomicrospira sp. R3]WFE68176.1 hypothetical protein P8S54_08095 [Thiomicrospira sp. R3]
METESKKLHHDVDFKYGVYHPFSKWRFAMFVFFLFAFLGGLYAFFNLFVQLLLNN